MKQTLLGIAAVALMFMQSGCQSGVSETPRADGVSVIAENQLPDVVKTSFSTQHPRALIKGVKVLSLKERARQYRITYLNPKGETEHEDFSPSGLGVKDSGNFPE